MLPLVAQQRRQIVVVLGVGGLAAAALAEHELVVVGALLRHEAGAVQIDTLLAPLGTAQQHPVARPDVAGLHGVQAAVGTQDDTGVHAALLRQAPLAVDLAVLRVHGGAVEIVGHHAVALRCLPPGVRRGGKTGLGKIGMMIFR